MVLQSRQDDVHGMTQRYKPQTHFTYPRSPYTPLDRQCSGRRGMKRRLMHQGGVRWARELGSGTAFACITCETFFRLLTWLLQQQSKRALMHRQNHGPIFHTIPLSQSTELLIPMFARSRNMLGNLQDHLVSPLLKPAQWCYSPADDTRSNLSWAPQTARHAISFSQPKYLGQSTSLGVHRSVTRFAMPASILPRHLRRSLRWFMRFRTAVAWPRPSIH